MHIQGQTHPWAETQSLKAAQTVPGRDISYHWHTISNRTEGNLNLLKTKMGRGKSYHEVKQQVQAAASKSRLWYNYFFLASNKLLITVTKNSKNLSGECKSLLLPAWWSWRRFRAAVQVPGRSTLQSILQNSLAPAEIIPSSAIYWSRLPKARSLFSLGFVPVFN